MERSDLTGRRRRAAGRKSMPDALIVTSKSDLREIIRDAVSEAVERYERVPELLSTKEMAARLDVSADTVRKWVSRDDCPCVRAGRTLRFREDAVIAWLEDRGG
ncbi:MAG: helix-turn-helix domain-containing protein [Polyangiales bacterium]